MLTPERSMNAALDTAVAANVGEPRGSPSRPPCARPDHGMSPLAILRRREWRSMRALQRELRSRIDRFKRRRKGRIRKDLPLALHGATVLAASVVVLGAQRPSTTMAAAPSVADASRPLLSAQNMRASVSPGCSGVAV